MPRGAIWSVAMGRGGNSNTSTPWLLALAALMAIGILIAKYLL